MLGKTKAKRGGDILSEVTWAGARVFPVSPGCLLLWESEVNPGQAGQGGELGEEGLLGVGWGVQGLW